jgi:hypothetical protein
MRPIVIPSPNEPSNTMIKLVIKTPLMNMSRVMDELCPKLEETFDTPCKIQYVSSSGIYYGNYLAYDFDDVLYTIQYMMDDFTRDNELVCDSVITLVGGKRTVRYRASSETCFILTI